MQLSWAGVVSISKDDYLEVYTAGNVKEDRKTKDSDDIYE